MQERIHFIGINGIGMSGIATVLAQRGVNVSGSDLTQSSRTEQLKALGAKIYSGHHPDFLDDGVDIVVYSSAIDDKNPELTKAKKKGLKILHRSEMLAMIVDQGKGIAIAGAHGKTTTTSMLAHIMLSMDLEPTVIVGGEIEQLQGNAGHGKGAYVVVEADESDGSLVNLNPYAVIVTNIDEDHLDYFGNLANIIKTFTTFTDRVPENGIAVFCGDDANNREVLAATNCPVITYGLNASNDYIIKGFKAVGCGSTFTLQKAGNEVLSCDLVVPGTHNALNAAGVLALLDYLGIDSKVAAAALKTFKGAKRRFNRLGSFKGADVIDDYAHHPKEIEATLQAAKSFAKGKIVAIFQPHRYSRTQFLFSDFAKAFSHADVVLITEIYSAGEAPLQGVSGEMIYQAMDMEAKAKSSFVNTLAEADSIVRTIVRQNDLIITMGAGDVWKVGYQLVELGE